MARIESNDLGRVLSSRIESFPGFSADYFVYATPGCEVLAEKWVFTEMLQEFLNNCGEKETDGRVQIGVQVSYDESTDMFHMSVEDNVAYDRDYAEKLASILNGAKVSHGKKRARTKVTGEGASDEPWLFVPHTRDVMQAWGGDLVFSVADDNTIRTDVTWNKTKMLTVRPPQLKASDIFG